MLGNKKTTEDPVRYCNRVILSIYLTYSEILGTRNIAQVLFLYNIPSQTSRCIIWVWAQ